MALVIWGIPWILYAFWRFSQLYKVFVLLSLPPTIHIALLYLKAWELISLCARNSRSSHVSYGLCLSIPPSLTCLPHVPKSWTLPWAPHMSQSVISKLFLSLTFLLYCPFTFRLENLDLPYGDTASPQSCPVLTLLSHTAPYFWTQRYWKCLFSILLLHLV